MKKLIIIITGIVFLGFQARSQDQEVTTYFGEKNGFSIDFPTDWSAGLKEAKAIFGVYITSVVGMKGDTPGAVVNISTVIGCKSSSSVMKDFKSIFEKEAKKSKDPLFKIHSEGEGERSGGKDFNYMEYSYTFHSDDGSTMPMHRKYIVTCHSYKGTKYAFDMSFQSREDDWSKFSDVYDKIFKSMKFN